MRVLIDRHSMQAVVHMRDGLRLSDMIADLVETLSCEVSFTAGDVLSAGELAAGDVLMVPTRSVWMARSCPDREDLAFSEEEIRAVVSFVRAGGGLFLLSNHGDFGQAPDHTQQDAALARTLGVDVECAAFGHRGELTHITGDYVLETHPVCTSGASVVQQVVTNNCTSIRPGAVEPIVSLPASMTDYRAGLKPDGRAFALAIDGATHGSVGDGRVVVCGDSGFLGSAGTTRPGPGLFDRGDNATLVRNAVAWLCRV